MHRIAMKQLFHCFFFLWIVWMLDVVNVVMFDVVEKSRQKIIMPPNR